MGTESALGQSEQSKQSAAGLVDRVPWLAIDLTLPYLNPELAWVLVLVQVRVTAAALHVPKA